MKKILILITIAMFATVSNAASINWTISNVYSSNDSTAKGSGYSALLFLTSNTSNVTGLKTTTLSEVTGLIGKSGWGDSIANKSSASATLNSDGTILAKETGISTDFSSGTVSGFAIIFDAGTLADAQHYYLVNGGSDAQVSFASATAAKTFLFRSQADASQSSSNWVAIPEPTSGLLMLLGVAGLALRRKMV